MSSKERPDQSTPNVRIRYEYARKFIQSLNKDIKILDIGCGEGWGSIVLAEFNVWAMDISFKSIRRAIRNNYNSKIIYSVMSTEHLGYRNNIFDVVCCFEVIEHLDCPDCLLKEIKRVLKPNGILLLSTPNRNYTKSLLPNPFHKKEYYFAEIKNILECYFSIEEFKGINICRARIGDIIRSSSPFKYYLKLKNKLGISNLELPESFQDKILPQTEERNISDDYINSRMFLIRCVKN
ncbi:MAG: class I SAM-dependent methyltransferase [Deltaproteobacteria bacterium]|nr:class I SAM-dependent methyltransferase [Deltaproteobacteria bacterium]